LKAGIAFRALPTLDALDALVTGIAFLTMNSLRAACSGQPNRAYGANGANGANLPPHHSQSNIGNTGELSYFNIDNNTAVNNLKFHQREPPSHSGEPDRRNQPKQPTATKCQL
jgi:hypothetical protein